MHHMLRDVPSGTAHAFREACVACCEGRGHTAGRDAVVLADMRDLSLPVNNTIHAARVPSLTVLSMVVTTVFASTRFICSMVSQTQGGVSRVAKEGSARQAPCWRLLAHI